MEENNRENPLVDYKRQVIKKMREDNPSWCTYVAKQDDMGYVCKLWLKLLDKLDEQNPFDNYSVQFYHSTGFYMQHCFNKCPFCKDTRYGQFGLSDYQAVTDVILQRSFKDFKHLAEDLDRIDGIAKQAEPCGLKADVDLLSTIIYYSGLIRHYAKGLQEEIERIKKYVGYKDNDSKQRTSSNVDGQVPEVRSGEQNRTAEG